MIRKQTIERLLQSAKTFVLYRLPGEDEVQLVMQEEGDAEVMEADADAPHGFLFAPFNETKYHPTLLIRPDIYAKGWDAINECTSTLAKKRPLLSNPPGLYGYIDLPSHSYHYKETFQKFGNALVKGRFEKLVLAYCHSNLRSLKDWEADVFQKALEAYPQSFVYLLYSRKGGRWMGCTPELFLQRNQKEWKTMALAGTHAFGDGIWDAKNIHEHDMVRKYIQKVLCTLGATYQMTPLPYTVQTGKLLHLRTDYTFHFSTPCSLMTVARALHPTPAVCGVPKAEALHFIIHNEGRPRAYYAGYLGPVGMDSRDDLFVNLRCAHIRSNDTLFYAGGGLNILSQEWEEAREIERKLDTLRQFLPY